MTERQRNRRRHSVTQPAGIPEDEEVNDASGQTPNGDSEQESLSVSAHESDEAEAESDADTYAQQDEKNDDADFDGYGTDTTVGTMRSKRMFCLSFLYFENVVLSLGVL